jgi:hypothetical protein
MARGVMSNSRASSVIVKVCSRGMFRYKMLFCAPQHNGAWTFRVNHFSGV